MKADCNAMQRGYLKDRQCFVPVCQSLPSERLVNPSVLPITTTTTTISSSSSSSISISSNSL
ncbi:hypothetical protein T11_10914 [Trichinella zimbabwensis]|uniref:Uncharacterized protein n=1 Tax=Trichinella zimbabwensis TaxID=268475 RepID=A0A0V1HRI6_9BILA|nr:hypothetical protein T11_10914 [Trichinella zimbabwensis]